MFTGETSRALVGYVEGRGLAKTVHLFDTFEGLPDLVTDEERLAAAGDELRAGHFLGGLESVVDSMGPFRQYAIHPGLFSDMFPALSSPVCFIHADADLYQSTVEIIRLADRLLVPGGRIMFDDYDNRLFPGIRLAIEKHIDPRRYEIEPSPETIQCFATKL